MDVCLLIRVFSVSLVGFQKFLLVCVAGMILEAWDIELERARSFAIMPSENNIEVRMYV